MTQALVKGTDREAGFVHYQFGLLYARWDKMPSALNHLHKALELESQDEPWFYAQVVEEVRKVREQQLTQRP